MFFNKYQKYLLKNIGIAPKINYIRVKINKLNNSKRFIMWEKIV